MRTVSFFAFYSNIYPEKRDWASRVVSDIFQVTPGQAMIALDELNRTETAVPYPDPTRNENALLDGIVEIQLRLAALEHYYPEIEGTRAIFIDKITAVIDERFFSEIQQRQSFGLSHPNQYVYMAGYPLLDQSATTSDVIGVSLVEVEYAQ